MPWHVANNPVINYANRIVEVGGNELGTDSVEGSKAKILNLSVKKFRNMMKQKCSDVEVFRLVPKMK